MPACLQMSAATSSTQNRAHQEDATHTKNVLNMNHVFGERMEIKWEGINSPIETGMGKLSSIFVSCSDLFTAVISTKGLFETHSCFIRQHVTGLGAKGPTAGTKRTILTR